MWFVAAVLVALPCAGSGFDLPDAERMALAAVRLTPGAARRGVVAKVEVVRALPEGWMLRAYAVPACASGVAVCSNLLGHYFVSRSTLALVDEDAGFDGLAVDTPATRNTRLDIVRAHCRRAARSR